MDEARSPLFAKRYVLIGLTVTAVDAIVFISLLNSGQSVTLAKTLAFLSAVALSLTLHKLWSFSGRIRKVSRQLIKIVLVTASGLALSLFSLKLCLRVMPPVEANFAASAVAIVWNFSFNTFWTFQRESCPDIPDLDLALDLSVVIPAYNEAARLPKTLTATKAYLDSRPEAAEIIVVDDGSRDGTAELALARGCKVLQLEQNGGKGAAVRAGVLAAQGRAVLIMDADLATPIEELARLEPYLGPRTLVLGSRYLDSSEVQRAQPWPRVLIGRVGNLLIQGLLLDAGIRDTQCGFKLFPTALARMLFRRQRMKSWGFDMEICALATLWGLEIKEIGVRWQDVGQSRLRPLRAALSTFGELLSIKVNVWLQRYRTDADPADFPRIKVL